MKHAKKLASLLLALVMVLSLATTAFAADGTGTITVSNSTKDATYSIYKVFSATVSEDGKTIAYQADAALPENAYFETDAKLNVTVKNAAKAADGSLTADAIAWLKANYVTGKTPSATMTGNGADLVFEDVPYGYYVVTSTVNNGAAVTVNSTMPNVTVIDKNQGPTWDNEPGEGDETGEDTNPGKVIIEDSVKKVVNSANYGDTVNFSIAVNATAYVGDKLVTNYYISDTLADGFSAAKNIVVKVGGQTLNKDTDYTLTQTGNSFEINIPFGTKYGSNAKIEVTYSATVETDAVIAGEGNLNTANFTYATKEFDPDNPGSTDPDNPGVGEKKGYEDSNKKTTTTYVYALGIKKVDPKGNALTGAEFSVTDAAGNDIYATATDTAGVYEFCAADAEGAVTQFKTDDKGVLIIKGLKAGTYAVKEEVAPAGYNLLPSTVDVTAEISETNTYTTTITTYFDDEGNVVAKDESVSSAQMTVNTNIVPLVVVNNAGTELPSTGGMGTTLFYVIGGLLVVAAAVLLITKKRMSQAER